MTSVELQLGLACSHGTADQKDLIGVVRSGQEALMAWEKFWKGGGETKCAEKSKPCSRQCLESGQIDSV